MLETTKYESVVLMGKITCGKGTQTAIIIEQFGGTMFSIGNKMRELMTMDTPLGIYENVTHHELFSAF